MKRLEVIGNKSIEEDLFDSLEKIFLGIKKDEMFVSGIRSVDKELEDKWDWVKLGSEERQNYLNFFTEGEWIINEKPPFIFFACLSEAMKKYIQRYAKNAMEEMDIEVIDFIVATYQEMQNLDLERVKGEKE